MTVQELIAQLQQLPPKAPIMVERQTNLLGQFYYDINEVATCGPEYKDPHKPIKPGGVVIKI